MRGEPVSHIQRPSLPWRPEHLTECRLANTVNLADRQAAKR